jgi:hypothetical protein
MTHRCVSVDRQVPDIDRGAIDNHRRHALWRARAPIMMCCGVSRASRGMSAQITAP